MSVIYSSAIDSFVKEIEIWFYSVFEDSAAVIINLLAFVILVLIVRKYLWKKVNIFIEKRQALLMETLESAESERKRALELQEKSQKDYELMKQETLQLKEKLTQDAYRQQEELIKKAKREAQRRLEQAEQDIQYEIEQANEKVKQSIKEVAFTAARKIVKREIDESIHQDIIEEVIKERSSS